MSDQHQSLPMAGRHTCACGEHDHELPELDARSIPHAIRHAAIFGALDSLGSGDGLILVAPHDPLPLLDQAHARYGDGLSVEYVQRGPDAWRIQLVRTA